MAFCSVPSYYAYHCPSCGNECSGRNDKNYSTTCPNCGGVDLCFGPCYRALVKIAGKLRYFCFVPTHCSSCFSMASFRSNPSNFRPRARAMCDCGMEFDMAMPPDCSPYCNHSLAIAKGPKD